MDEFEEKESGDSAGYEPAGETENRYRETKIRKLTKSSHDRIISGVCGGLGNYFSMSPLFFRMIFLFGIVLGGWGLIAYLVSAILIKSEPDEKQISESELESIRKNNNVSLIAGIIFVAGLYMMLSEYGYFEYFSNIGISSPVISLLVIGTVFFLALSLSLSGIEPSAPKERFTRSRRKNLFAGVCSGFAEYINVSPGSVRIFFLFLSLLTLGIPFLIYFYFIYAVPAEEPDAE